jgi:hypothetical protein
MASPTAERLKSLVSQAAVDAREAADRLYALQLALRGAGDAYPVEAPEAAALQRKAADLAEALHDIETRRGWA